MTSRSYPGEERPQREPRASLWTRFSLRWKRAWTVIHSRSGTGEEERPQHEPDMPPRVTLDDGIQTSSTSNLHPQCPEQERLKDEDAGFENQLQDGLLTSGSAKAQEKEETSQHEDQPQGGTPSPNGREKEKISQHEDQLPEGPLSPDSEVAQKKEKTSESEESQQREPFSQEQEGQGDHVLEGQSQVGSPLSISAVHTDKNEGLVITNIRVTEPALGLRRVPAGFYVIVQHSGLEWRTENKSLSVSDDVIEWSDPIPLPSDVSAAVRLEVYASFEFQPMLGTGEHLRKLTITTKQLLERSEKHISFSFFPKDGDVVSPCSSIVVAVEQHNDENRVLGRLRPTADVLGDATNHGHMALACYRKHGQRRDLERSIAEFEQALDTCPLNHPCRAAVQSNLAMAKFILCQVCDTNPSFEVPLGLYRDALAVRPVSHADHPSTLIQLAAVHLVRFEKQRSGLDRACVEALLHDAMGLRSIGSHEKRAVSFILELYAKVGTSNQSSVDSLWGSWLTDEDPWNLGRQLLERFRRYGDLAVLQRAITLLQTLVGSTSVWNDQCCAGLGNLALALWLRYKHLGELSDLEQAISTHRDTVALTPDGHHEKAGRLSNLGSALLARFQRLGELSDLEDAISTYRSALGLTPDGHPHRSGHLSNLGFSFFTRFERLGELSDLEHAISTQRDAVDLTPDGQLGKPGRLTNLGNSFVARFERLGELSDLEHAISAHRDAVNLSPDDYPGKPSFLNNLSLAFKARFDRLGELDDLERAISMARGALSLIPDGHPDRPGYLNNLGSSLISRFHRLGELNDLQHAISILRNAVDLTPDGHPNKSHRLNNLGISFTSRFRRLGDLSDLEHAILIYRNAIDLTPDGYPAKLRCMINLGNTLRTRFEHLGELSDIEHAISMQIKAVDSIPDGHPDKPRFQTDLGLSFIIRFRRLGELSDLEHAISIHKGALDLTPDGHLEKPRRLNNLGLSFYTRFRHLGELNDIEHAISTLRDAVDLTPDGHPGKAHYLSNLGLSFSARFSYLKEPSDLEDAISAQVDAVNLTPDSDPDKPSHLSNLGTFFVARFKLLGELSDLEHAISRHRNAVNLTPDGHAEKAGYLNNLGFSFRARFACLKQPNDLVDAISLHSRCASYPIGPIRVRFLASRSWILCARHIRHPSLLRAYSTAIGLLPQLAWIGFSLSRRYAELKGGTDVVREAAAAALDSGLPERAVEWLEQGRSIVWGELFQLRGSYDQLSSTYPDHARQLQELSAALDNAGATREQMLSTTQEEAQSMTHRALQDEASRHRALTLEREKLLQEIRRLPGFERFLLPKHFSQLRASAHSGPVVLLNAARTRCDALIVLANVDHVVHVPLPNFDLKRAVRLQGTMRLLLGDARMIPTDDRVGNPARRGHVNWESLLSTLWNDVVKPVLDGLAFSTLEELSRIFWCPTGPFVFLPIHAAGLYGTQRSSPGDKISDFVISSYVPTLGTLVRSSNKSMTPSGDLRLLTVPQPSSDGQCPLRGVAIELGHIKTVLRDLPSGCTTLVESSVGTVEEVLDLMKDADWVHFACHGVQDADKPTDSGLCLADQRRLKISDIIGLSRSRGGLAFLSACQTAMGDEGLSDEAIHITAGMLFAGYNGVIGTMWSISDRLAPVVAREVYKYLFRNGTRPDCGDAARALHDAVGRLRESEEASFVTWLPFIHVGL